MHSPRKIKEQKKESKKNNFSLLGFNDINWIFLLLYSFCGAV